METIDPRKAAAVWQRVHAAPPGRPEPHQLLAWIQDYLWELELYRLLGRQNPGRKERLNQLTSLVREQIQCLKGMYRMITDQIPQIPRTQSQSGPHISAVRKCCAVQLQHLTQYEACLKDPEYGHVFSVLLRRERERCASGLTLLADLPE